MVNNAGGSPYALAADASPRFHQKIVELNLLGMLHVSQAANAVMQTQPQGGSIVSISSVSGSRPSPGTAAYGAAKAGVDSLTTTLAVEWAPKVRVNAVVAGMVAHRTGRTVLRRRRVAGGRRRDRPAGTAGQARRHRLGRSVSGLRRGRPTSAAPRSRYTAVASRRRILSASSANK